jgi:hypothetical protein
MLVAGRDKATGEDTSPAGSIPISREPLALDSISYADVRPTRGG